MIDLTALLLVPALMASLYMAWRLHHFEKRLDAVAQLMIALAVHVDQMEEDTE